jgi:hypothetical protein
MSDRFVLLPCHKVSHTLPLEDYSDLSNAAAAIGAAIRDAVHIVSGDSEAIVMITKAGKNVGKVMFYDYDNHIDISFEYTCVPDTTLFVPPVDQEI